MSRYHAIEPILIRNNRFTDSTPFTFEKMEFNMYGDLIIAHWFYSNVNRKYKLRKTRRSYNGQVVPNNRVPYFLKFYDKENTEDKGVITTEMTPENINDVRIYLRAQEMLAQLCRCMGVYEVYSGRYFGHNKRGFCKGKDGHFVFETAMKGPNSETVKITYRIDSFRGFLYNVGRNLVGAFEISFRNDETWDEEVIELKPKHKTERRKLQKVLYSCKSLRQFQKKLEASIVLAYKKRSGGLKSVYKGGV